MAGLRKSILGIGLLGAFVFGAAFVTSFVAPAAIESLVKDFVRREVQRQVEESITALEGGQLARLAARAISRNNASIDRARQALGADLRRKVASVVAEMQDPACPCRAFMNAAVTGYYKTEVVGRTGANERLTALIRTKYMQVTASLIREFRIVTAANALVFVLLGAVAFRRGRAALQLTLPAVVLIAGAATVGLLYLFGQNWLHTILFNDYVGFAYFAYLAVVLALLADVVLNRAIVTTHIVNAAFNVVGAAIQAVPC
jgi:hypothetical protein